MKCLMCSKKGSTLAVVAVVLVVLLMVAALSIDLGMMFKEKQRLQNAADAAALAGAKELPESVSQAVSQAEAIANENRPGVKSVACTIPYKSDPKCIQVVLTGERPSVFAGIFGKTTALVRARAAARCTYAFTGLIHVNDSSGGAPDKCLTYTGGSGNLTGSIHSNGYIKISGNGNTFRGGMTYVKSVDDSSTSNIYDPPYKSTSKRPMPLSYVFSDFPSTYYFVGDLNVGGTSSLWVGGDVGTRQLRPGVIVATGDISNAITGWTGNVTFVAGGKLRLSGGDWNMTAYWNNICGYAGSNEDDAMVISSSGATQTGYFFCPAGKIRYSGSSGTTVNGGFVSDTLLVSGSSMVMNSGSVGRKTVKLIE